MSFKLKFKERKNKHNFNLEKFGKVHSIVDSIMMLKITLNSWERNDYLESECEPLVLNKQINLLGNIFHDVRY